MQQHIPTSHALGSTGIYETCNPLLQQKFPQGTAGIALQNLAISLFLHHRYYNFLDLFRKRPKNAVCLTKSCHPNRTYILFILIFEQNNELKYISSPLLMYSYFYFTVKQLNSSLTLSTSHSYEPATRPTASLTPRPLLGIVCCSHASAADH